MIRIEVIDPATCSKDELRALAAFLTACADGVQVKISPDDNPAVGAFSQQFAAAARERIEHTHGSLALDADAAKLNATFGQGAAGPTFGDVHWTAHNEVERAAAAFGGTPAPNAAPSFAAAAPHLTVPAVPTPTSIVPGSVPLPPVPNAGGSAATAALPAPPAPPAPGVKLDSAGLPWDARIHSGGGAVIANGNWKMKRGVTPELVAQVEAELRGVMAIPAPPPAAWPFTPPGEAPNVPTPGAPPPSSVSTAAQDPAIASHSETPMSFAQLVAKITQAKVAGTMTDAHIQQALAMVGVQALPLLAARPDIIPSMAAALDQLTGA